jgi:hypothetical protein
MAYLTFSDLTSGGLTSPVLWTLIGLQIAMGGFDTLFHHEMTERLAWRPSQHFELRLHGARNLIYALLFLALGWTRPQGLWAMAVIALLFVEAIITLIDFVEEDRSRSLPASERVTHTLLALNYGAILALLLPVLGASSAAFRRRVSSSRACAMSPPPGAPRNCGVTPPAN